ncbi:MAG: cell division protein FtsA [Bacteroidales bacterium]
MSSKENYVAAIDIGTTKIVAIVGKRNDQGNIEILGLSKAPSIGVRRGVVQNIEETVNAIQKTVDDVQNRSGIMFNEVFVGIAGQHIKSMRSRGYINREKPDDEITRDDVYRLVEDMYNIPIEIGEEIIHVLPQSFIVDGETGINNPVGMCGRRLEANFHIVIGQVSSAKNIDRCIRRCRLTVKDLILEPLASSEAVLTDEEKEAGVVLIDIGGGTTDVAIYHDSIIRHTAVIPFGGNVVTNDIKEGCAILSKYAEALKHQYGSALGDIAPEDKVVSIPGIAGRDPKEISFKSLAYIIQSRMEEILDAVNFEIQLSGYGDKLAAGAVITGGGAMLKNLPQLVRFKTAMDVRIGYPNEHLHGEARNEINQPMFATSVGLIMKGFEYLENHHEDFGAGKADDYGHKEAANNSDEQDDFSGSETRNNRNSIANKIMNAINNLFEMKDQDISL